MGGNERLKQRGMTREFLTPGNQLLSITNKSGLKEGRLYVHRFDISFSFWESIIHLEAGMDGVAWRGFLYLTFILSFVFACQLFLLPPLVSALGTSLLFSVFLYFNFSSFPIQMLRSAFFFLNFYFLVFYYLNPFLIKVRLFLPIGLLFSSPNIVIHLRIPEN